MSDYFAARWMDFSNLPEEDGSYIVAHRGNMVGTAYFKDGRWYLMPKWGPTHWLLDDRKPIGEFNGNQKWHEHLDYNATEGFR